MPIFLRVLMLLACGPLLVPSHLCVCHADITDLDPHPHETDCPPSEQVKPPQPTLPVLTLADLGPTPEPFFAAHTATAPDLPVTPTADHISSPPLFVSHCALIL